MHACRHANPSRHGHLHTPIARSSNSDLFTLFLTHFSTSGRSDHTNWATIFTQHSLGQFWPQILQFQTAALFFTELPCDFYSIRLSEAGSKTKFVAGALQAPRRCCPPVVVVLVTLLVTPQAASTNLLYLQASSNRLALTIQSQDHNRQGRDAGH